MKKVMLIGFGAMAQAVIERLPAGVAIGSWRAHLTMPPFTTSLAMRSRR